MGKDFYEILGVDPDATQEEIKRAYRAIIKLCHPDSPECHMTPAELHRVQKAYETLSDSRKRSDYDRRSFPFSPSEERYVRPGRSESGAGTMRRAGPSPFSHLFSLFDDFFSSSRESPEPSGRGKFPRGCGIPRRKLDILLTAEEAGRGGVFEIAVPDFRGRSLGSFSLAIPPNVPSGTTLTVDLEELLGAPGAVDITILVEGERRG
jgi:DnaJ-class molecular chaperone